MMEKIRILVADDHTLIRSGLRVLLDREPGLEVVAEAGTGRRALELAEAEKPDVVMLDIAMPEMNGIEVARQISEKLPKTGIIMLSMHSDEGYVLRALKAGARGYLLKNSLESDIVNAVRAVGEGKAYLSPEISRVLVEDYVRQMRQKGTEDSYDLLSTREREVFLLLAEGRSNKEISGALNVSLSTVETHRTNIFQKLGLHNIAELILYAVRKGLIS